ncbi:hypothetical protein PAHAL_3G307600 [Panicum hallii]|uniref:Uncharacterized protein n=1 Tax=Panicum hallii TaxID=206008 RepID=A0A2S3HCR9_9POAL|nr:hypothetical protein PAHAL_3G307600 [Panicum hallii]
MASDGSELWQRAQTPSSILHISFFDPNELLLALTLLSLFVPGGTQDGSAAPSSDHCPPARRPRCRRHRSFDRNRYVLAQFLGLGAQETSVNLARNACDGGKGGGSDGDGIFKQREDLPEGHERKTRTILIIPT